MFKSLKNNEILIEQVVDKRRRFALTSRQEKIALIRPLGTFTLMEKGEKMNGQQR